VLRDATDHDIVIPLSSIESAQRSRTSLMPVGLADGLTRPELIDLVRFLSELGKVGPYSLSKAPIARRWQALVLPAHVALAKAIVDDPSLQWTPAYSRVSGELPLADLPRVTADDNEPISILRCRLEAAAAGPVRFKLNSPAGLAIWIDQKPIEARPEFDIDLAVGQHTVVVELHRNERNEPLRLELTDLPGSSDRATFFGGK
jgi:hypothetical protein